MPNETSAERAKTAEELRLDAAREQGLSWRQWGPYLSERQWGTVEIFGKLDAKTFLQGGREETFGPEKKTV